jgi:hypothetical protein
MSRRSDAEYQMWDLGKGRIEVREAGGVAHMQQHEDGTWTVEENLQDQVFETQGQALDCARDIMANTRGENRQ